MKCESKEIFFNYYKKISCMNTAFALASMHAKKYEELTFSNFERFGHLIREFK